MIIIIIIIKIIIKTLNGFIFMDTKTKQVSRRQIFTNLSVNRKIPEKRYTQRLISQNLICRKIKFLKVTKAIPVNTQSKLNAQKVLI